MQSSPPGADAIDISDEEPLHILTLPDAVVQHAFSIVGRSDPASLGRCTAVCTRWAHLAADDALWRTVCRDWYGLETPKPLAPPGDPECGSFFRVAGCWSERRRHLGLSSRRWPTLAPWLTRAAEAWDRISSWASEHLPEAHATIGRPVSVDDWRLFVKRVAPTVGPPAEDHGSGSGSGAAVPEPAPSQCQPCATASESVSESGLLALRLLSSIHDGQQLAHDARTVMSQGGSVLSDHGLVETLERLEALAVEQPSSERSRFLGLCGGYSAYDQCVSTRLFPLPLIVAWTAFFADRWRGEMPSTFLVVAASFNLRKLLMLDASDGRLWLGPANLTDASGPPDAWGGREVYDGETRIPLLRAVPADTPAGSDLIAWLSELSSRMHSGIYVAEHIVPLRPETRGVALFPRAGPRLSISTHRGIRIIASAVFCAELGMFTYSIRIALLCPGDDGYMPPEARGFTSAQLHTRHWKITGADGNVDTVDGAGVVGRYPLLREGGWRDDMDSMGSGEVRKGTERSGVFVYQSMSGRGLRAPSARQLAATPASTRAAEPGRASLANLPSTARRAGSIGGSFEGEMSFVPGTLKYPDPDGAEFRVPVARFALSCGADEFLF